MKLTWDEVKRQKTLTERKLDFADAAEVFADVHLEFPDDRQDYGEPRYITVGFLANRMVVIVYTPRGNSRHIISMRKANAREIKRYQTLLERS